MKSNQESASTVQNMSAGDAAKKNNSYARIGTQGASGGSMMKLLEMSEQTMSRDHAHRQFINAGQLRMINTTTGGSGAAIAHMQQNQKANQTLQTVSSIQTSSNQIAYKANQARTLNKGGEKPQLNVKESSQNNTFEYSKDSSNPFYIAKQHQEMYQNKIISDSAEQASLQTIQKLIIKEQLISSNVNKDQAVRSEPNLSTTKESRKSSQSGPIMGQTSQAKHYRYWIDVRDYLSMLQYCLIQVQNCPICSQEVWDPDQSNSQSIIIEESKAGFNPTSREDQESHFKNQRTINSIAESDREIMTVLMRFMSNFSLQCDSKKLHQSQNLLLEDILQMRNTNKKVYWIENAKVVTQVHQSKKREDITSALNELIEKLKQYQSKYPNKTLRLCFSSQKELYSICLKVFGKEVLSNMVIRKIFSEAYETFLLYRDVSSIGHSIAMNAYFYLKVELFARGRALYDSSNKTFPLHKAVFENNLPLISRLINGNSDGIFYQEKNEIDACGHTPLILAIKLGHIDTIKVLCDLFCCPKLKSLQNFPCALDVASSIKNKEIIKTLLEANQKIKQHYLDLHKEAMFKALENLPDFKIDMHFSCRSNFIPFLGNITPSDTYRIYKQGSKLRLDMTLVGFRHLKCIRGNLSVLFKGRGQENEGEIFVVDHDTKQVSNIFNNVVYAKLDKDLEDIMSDAQYQKLYKADKFTMEPEIDKKKGDILSKMIDGFKAEKYNLRTQFTMTKYKISIQDVQIIQKYRSFEEYLQGASQQEQYLDQFEGNELEKIGQNLQKTENNRKTENANASQERQSANSQAVMEQYNQSNSLKAIMGMTTKNKKVSKKTINASIWLCKSHPLSLDSFLPLLQVLSFSSKQIAKFKDYIMKYNLPPGSFPLKAKIPIFFTMKAAFSLQNLSFDPSSFPSSLFTIDEEYQKIQFQKSLDCMIYQRSLQAQRQQSNQEKSEADLEQIYKLFKTNEDFNNEEEDEEDQESLQRANEMFNSMIKKEVQNEQLLLESFHSEYDSVDLSERHLNDEQFKLATHAFTQIQTMNSINVRHHGDDVPNQLHSNDQQLIPTIEYRKLIGVQKPTQEREVTVMNQTTISDAENLFDSKILDEKPMVNYISTKRLLNRMQKPPLNAHAVLATPPSGTVTLAQDSVKTLKKNFQPRNFKNYKNMIKYNCNQQELFDGADDQCQNKSFAQQSESKSSNTVQKSTADNSVITGKQEQGKESLGANWFKQIFNYKFDNHHAKRDGPGYLQTIESEEVMATEGCQIEANSNYPANQNRNNGIDGQSSMHRSSILSQGYYDDTISRKSGTIQGMNVRDNMSIRSIGSNKSKNNDNNTLNEKADKLSINREEKKTLANHNVLIDRFHNYVLIKQQKGTQHPQSLANIIQKTPTRGGINMHQSISPSNASLNQSIENNYDPHSRKGNTDGFYPEQTNNQQTLKLQQSENRHNSNLLPPKIAHKRQSSYGAGSSDASNQLGLLTINAQQSQPQQKTDINNNSGENSIKNLFNKLFGATGDIQKPTVLHSKTTTSKFNEAKTFMASGAYQQQQQLSRQEAAKQFVFGSAQSIPQKMNTVDIRMMGGGLSPKVQSSISKPLASQTLGIVSQQNLNFMPMGSLPLNIGQSRTNQALLISQSQKSQLGLGHKRTNDADIQLSYQV